MKEIFHPPLPRDNIRTPQAAIEKLINEEAEYIYVFKNNKQILRVKGDRDKVIVEDGHLYCLYDSIVIHNHPSGQSFSIEDLLGLIKYNAKECILVTKNYTYHLFRPMTGWDIDVESDLFHEQFNACKKIAENELGKAVMRREINEAEKEVEIFHYIWLFFFTELNGVKYVRKKNA